MRRSFLVVLSLSCIVVVSLAFTRVDPIYKNLKVLPKNITQRQMDSVMNHYSVSLNVGCDFCHVENKEKTDMDFASDANKHKLIARDMIEMTNKINDKYFDVTGGKRSMDSKLMVTCFTCHNGQKEPAVKPQDPPVPEEIPVADTTKRK